MSTYRKRKRLARPKLLVLFACLFFLLPFFNVYFAARRFTPGALPSWATLGQMSVLMHIVTFVPIFVGIGLLSMKRRGFLLFVVYAIFAIAYNSYEAVILPSVRNFSAALQTYFLMIAAGYFARVEIFAPYFNPNVRGWRWTDRRPIRMDVNVSGNNLKTRDFSSRGIYVEWSDCHLELNSGVQVSFRLGKKDFTVDGGIVRTDHEGVGIAFRNLDRQTREAIGALLGSA